MRRRDYEPVEGGQGRSAESVVEAALVFCGCVLGGAAFVAIQLLSKLLTIN